jgi:hypothetical protein
MKEKKSKVILLRLNDKICVTLVDIYKVSFTQFLKDDKLSQLDHVVMFYSTIYEYILKND